MNYLQAAAKRSETDWPESICKLIDYFEFLSKINSYIFKIIICSKCFRWKLLETSSCSAENSLKIISIERTMDKSKTIDTTENIEL